jgi:hypothetical protein
MGRACNTHGGNMYVYRIFVGRPEGDRPLGTPRHRWEDNIISLGKNYRPLSFGTSHCLATAASSGCTILAFSRQVELHSKAFREGHTDSKMIT